MVRPHINTEQTCITDLIVPKVKAGREDPHILRRQCLAYVLHIGIGHLEGPEAQRWAGCPELCS